MRRPKILEPAKSAQWDHFVGEHPLGQIYHLTAWKNVLERCFKHIKGFFYVLSDEDGRIQAGIPVYKVRSWLTGTRLVCAPYATLFDPLVSDRAQMSALSGAIIEASRQLHCAQVEIRTYLGGRYIEDDSLGASRFYKLHYLRLDSSLDSLKRGFHRTCVRQRISRAEKSGLNLKVADRRSDLRTFYSLLSMTRTRRGLPPHPFAYFEALWEHLKPLDLLKLMIAEKDGRAIASILLLTYKGRVSVEFAASDEAFLRYSPIHFLFWEAIRWAHGSGFQIIDFGRTSPNNRTLMEFKERWGTECVDLPHFYYPGEAAASDSRREDDWRFALINRLIASPIPSSFKEYIGAFCYRHMG